LGNREQVKSRAMSMEMKLWGEWPSRQGMTTKPMMIFFSELKINPVVKKIQNYRNKRVQHVWKRQTQTTKLNYEITVWDTKTRTNPTRLLNH
jgi:hypothetical protein